MDAVQSSECSIGASLQGCAIIPLRDDPWQHLRRNLFSHGCHIHSEVRSVSHFAVKRTDTGVTPVSGVCRSATDAIDPFRTLVVTSVSVRFSSEVTILRFPFSVRVGPASSLSQHTGQTPTHGYASYTVHLGPRAGERFAFRADRCACQTSAGGRKH